MRNPVLNDDGTTLRCDNCLWYEAAADVSGLCHYNPPVMMVLTPESGAVTVWPMVDDDDWCHRHSYVAAVNDEGDDAS